MAEPTTQASARRPDDRFHARVRELVRIHGPADALELHGAARMAAEVLLHGLVEANDHRALGIPLVELAAVRGLAEGVMETILTVADGVFDHPHLRAGQIGGWIALALLAESRHWTYLDTDEIPELVAVAYGVALEVYRRDFAAARRLVLGLRPE